MTKNIIDFLTKLSNILTYLAETLRYTPFHEEYYVYVPSKNKPRYIHKNYRSARDEAERIFEKLDPWETIEILQVVNRFEKDEIPF